LKTHTDITTIRASFSNYYYASILFITYSHSHAFSGYAFAHSFEEEESVHNEPYGYELGDDVMLLYLLIEYSHLRFKPRQTILGCCSLLQPYPSLTSHMLTSSSITGKLEKCFTIKDSLPSKLKMRSEGSERKMLRLEVTNDKLLTFNMHLFNLYLNII
jgi:hypothetical protein